MSKPTPLPEPVAALRAATAAAVAAFGKRGLAAIDQLTRNGQHTLAAVDGTAKSHRRKGVTHTAAKAAARGVLDARTAMADYRAKRRREMGRGKRRVSPRHVHRCWPTSEIADELDRHRRLDVSAEIERAYMHGTTTVEWVATAEETGITVGYIDEWDGYSKRCKYPKRHWSIAVRAVRYPAADLPGAGLHCDGVRDHDGLVLLAADAVPSPDGQCRAWNGVWLRKGAGVSWTRVTGGIIEAPDGTVVHGTTVASALSTYRRRQTIAQTDALARRFSCGRAEALERFGGVQMRWADARRAGLCAEGIEAWAAAHFPDRDARRDTVTVAEALGTRTSEPLVLQAVAIAVARSRRAQIAAAA